MINKKTKTIVAFLMSVIMLFASVVPAYALSSGDNCTFTTKYLDAYYATGKWKTANGKTHDNQGQVALRRIKSTGEPLYCLQVYKETSGSNATAGNIKNTTVWKDELTFKAQQGITRVSIWGYPNFDYGYSKDNAQLATQVLIWEFETGARTDYSTGCNTWAKTIFKNYPYALKCYNEILEACSSHKSLPDFGISHIVLKGVGPEYAKTVIDKNGVLNKFTVSCDNSNIVVSQSGNNLTVYAKRSGNLVANLSFTKDKTNINSALALNGANQIMLYGTLADPVHHTLKVSLTEGVLSINKESEDGIVEGFDFKVKGNGFDKTVTTDKNGKVSLYNMKAGTYTVTEQLKDNQSRYIPQSSKTVIVTGGEESYVSFTNELIKGSAVLNKLDSETNQNIETKDGIFKVQQWSQKENKYVDYKEMSWVDKWNGYVVYNLTVTADNNGRFRCVEVKAPTGYVTPANLTYDFVIDENNESIRINDGAVLNDAQKAVIHIDKNGEMLDSFDFIQTEYGKMYAPVYKNQLLEGTKWEISALEDIVSNGQKNGEMLDSFDFIQTEYGKMYAPVYKNQLLEGTKWEISALEDIVSNGQTKYKKGDVVELITTTEKGATSKPLYLGRYLVKEVETVDGFFIGSSEYEIELGYKGADINIYTENITANNERQHFKMNFTKTFETNEMYPNVEAYKDVVFGVYAAEDIKDSNNEVILEKDSLVDCFTKTFETNEMYPNVEAYKDVVFGVYAAEDIKDSNNEVILEKDSLVDCIAIDEDGNGMSDVDFPANTKWYLQELKTAEGYVLNNTKYEFETKAGDSKNPIIWIDLNEDGTVIENKWYLQELKTAEGYVLNNTKYEFETKAGDSKNPIIWIDLNEDGTVIENKVIKASVEFKKFDKADENTELIATYGLYRASDNKLLAKETSTIGEWTSFGEYPFGEYYIQEIESPEGYEKDTEKYPVIIDGKNSVETSTIGEWTSFGEYPFGEYYIQEIESPEGYEKDTEKYPVIIDGKNSVVQIKVYNEKTPIIPVPEEETETPDIPNTGSTKTMGIVVLAVCSVGLIGIVVYLIVSKKSKTTNLKSKDDKKMNNN